MPQTQVLSDSTGEIRPGPPEFVCILRDGGFDAAWVHVGGELDIATAPLLEQALRRAETRPRVVLDLRELAFMDCFSLGVIIRASLRATRMGRRLVLVRGGTEVDRVLTLGRASKILQIVELRPAEPPVQALVRLAHQEHAA